MITAVGGKSAAETTLKTTSGWFGSDNGTDDYSFSALPAGSRDNDGSYIYGGNYAYFWSSTENYSYYAYYMFLYYDHDYALLNFGKDAGFSVRCVKDE